MRASRTNWRAPRRRGSVGRRASSARPFRHLHVRFAADHRSKRELTQRRHHDPRTRCPRLRAENLTEEVINLGHTARSRGTGDRRCFVAAKDCVTSCFAISSAIARRYAVRRPNRGLTKSAATVSHIVVAIDGGTEPRRFLRSTGLRSQNRSRKCGGSGNIPTDVVLVIGRGPCSI